MRHLNAADQRSERRARGRLRRLLLVQAMATACVLLFWGARARAGGEQAIVCLIGLGAHGPALLHESSLRARAELQAAGFEVLGGMEESEGGETRECPIGSATISLEVTGNVLTIWAQVSEAHLPLSQAVDLTNQSEARADVIAIRAVDGLRAAVLEAIVANQGVVSRPLAEFASARRSGVEPENIEPSVRPPEPKRAPALEADRAQPYRGQSRAPRRPASEGRLVTVIGFGPELTGGAGGVGLSFGASLDFWWKFVGVGLVADVALLSPVWETQTSRISIHEYGFGARGQLSLCGRPLVCQLGVGGSMRTVALDAVQTMNGSELLERGAHVSPVLDLGGGLGYWFGESVGIFASGRVHLYGDAPRLIVGSDENVWGRPSYTVSVGPWFRL